MHRAAAGLIVFAGEALAHPGHGGPEGHFHWLGVEHAIVFAVMFLILALAIRK
jgi:hypothetical protein